MNKSKWKEERYLDNNERCSAAPTSKIAEPKRANRNATYSKNRKQRKSPAKKKRGKFEKLEAPIAVINDGSNPDPVVEFCKDESVGQGDVNENGKSFSRPFRKDGNWWQNKSFITHEGLEQKCVKIDRLSAKGWFLRNSPAPKPKPKQGLHQQKSFERTPVKNVHNSEQSSTQFKSSGQHTFSPEKKTPTKPYRQISEQFSPQGKRHNFEGNRNKTPTGGKGKNLKHFNPRLKGGDFERKQEVEVDDPEPDVLTPSSELEESGSSSSCLWSCTSSGSGHDVSTGNSAEVSPQSPDCVRNKRVVRKKEDRGRQQQHQQGVDGSEGGQHLYEKRRRRSGYKHVPKEYSPPTQISLLQPQSSSSPPQNCLHESQTQKGGTEICPPAKLQFDISDTPTPQVKEVEDTESTPVNCGKFQPEFEAACHVVLNTEEDGARRNQQAIHSSNSCDTNNLETRFKPEIQNLLPVPACNLDMNIPYESYFISEIFEENPKDPKDGVMGGSCGSSAASPSIIEDEVFVPEIATICQLMPTSSGGFSSSTPARDGDAETRFLEGEDMFKLIFPRFSEEFEENCRDEDELHSNSSSESAYSANEDGEFILEQEQENKIDVAIFDTFVTKEAKEEKVVAVDNDVNKDNNEAAKGTEDTAAAIVDDLEKNTNDTSTSEVEAEVSASWEETRDTQEPIRTVSHEKSLKKIQGVDFIVREIVKGSIIYKCKRAFSIFLQEDEKISDYTKELEEDIFEEGFKANIRVAEDTKKEKVHIDNRPNIRLAEVEREDEYEYNDWDDDYYDWSKDYSYVINEFWRELFDEWETHKDSLVTWEKKKHTDNWVTMETKQKTNVTEGYIEVGKMEGNNSEEAIKTETPEKSAWTRQETTPSGQVDERSRVVENAAVSDREPTLLSSKQERNSEGEMSEEGKKLAKELMKDNVEENKSGEMRIIVPGKCRIDSLLKMRDEYATEELQEENISAVNDEKEETNEPKLAEQKLVTKEPKEDHKDVNENIENQPEIADIKDGTGRLRNLVSERNDADEMKDKFDELPNFESEFRSWDDIVTEEMKENKEAAEKEDENKDPLIATREIPESETVEPPFLLRGVWHQYTWVKNSGVNFRTCYSITDEKARSLFNETVRAECKIEPKTAEKITVTKEPKGKAVNEKRVNLSNIANKKSDVKDISAIERLRKAKKKIAEKNSVTNDHKAFNEEIANQSKTAKKNLNIKDAKETPGNSRVQVDEGPEIFGNTALQDKVEVNNGEEVTMVVSTECAIENLLKLRDEDVMKEIKEEIYDKKKETNEPEIEEQRTVTKEPKENDKTFNVKRANLLHAANKKADTKGGTEKLGNLVKKRNDIDEVKDELDELPNFENEYRSWDDIVTEEEMKENKEAVEKEDENKDPIIATTHEIPESETVELPFLLRGVWHHYTWVKNNGMNFRMCHGITDEKARSLFQAAGAEVPPSLLVPRPPPTSSTPEKKPSPSTPKKAQPPSGRGKNKQIPASPAKKNQPTNKDKGKNKRPQDEKTKTVRRNEKFEAEKNERQQKWNEKDRVKKDKRNEGQIEKQKTAKKDQTPQNLNKHPAAIAKDANKNINGVVQSKAQKRKERRGKLENLRADVKNLTKIKDNDVTVKNKVNETHKITKNTQANLNDLRDDFKKVKDNDVTLKNKVNETQGRGIPSKSEIREKLHVKLENLQNKRKAKNQRIAAENTGNQQQNKPNIEEETKGTETTANENVDKEKALNVEEDRKVTKDTVKGDRDNDKENSNGDIKATGKVSERKKSEPQQLQKAIANTELREHDKPNKVEVNCKEVQKPIKRDDKAMAEVASEAKAVKATTPTEGREGAIQRPILKAVPMKRSSVTKGQNLTFGLNTDKPQSTPVEENQNREKEPNIGTEVSSYKESLQNNAEEELQKALKKPASIEEEIKSNQEDIRNLAPYIKVPIPRAGHSKEVKYRARTGKADVNANSTDSETLNGTGRKPEKTLNSMEEAPKARDSMDKPKILKNDMEKVSPEIDVITEQPKPLGQPNGTVKSILKKMENNGSIKESEDMKDKISTSDKVKKEVKQEQEPRSIWSPVRSLMKLFERKSNQQQEHQPPNKSNLLHKADPDTSGSSLNGSSVDPHDDEQQQKVGCSTGCSKCSPVKSSKTSPSTTKDKERTATGSSSSFLQWPSFLGVSEEMVSSATPISSESKHDDNEETEKKVKKIIQITQKDGDRDQVNLLLNEPISTAKKILLAVIELVKAHEIDSGQPGVIKIIAEDFKSLKELCKTQTSVKIDTKRTTKNKRHNSLEVMLGNLLGESYGNTDNKKQSCDKCDSVQIQRTQEKSIGQECADACSSSSSGSQDSTTSSTSETVKSFSSCEEEPRDSSLSSLNHGSNSSISISGSDENSPDGSLTGYSPRPGDGILGQSAWSSSVNKSTCLAGHFRLEPVQCPLANYSSSSDSADSSNNRKIRRPKRRQRRVKEYQRNKAASTSSPELRSSPDVTGQGETEPEQMQKELRNLKAKIRQKTVQKERNPVKGWEHSSKTVTQLAEPTVNSTADQCEFTSGSGRSMVSRSSSQEFWSASETTPRSPTKDETSIVALSQATSDGTVMKMDSLNERTQDATEPLVTTVLENTYNSPDSVFEELEGVTDVSRPHCEEGVWFQWSSVKTASNKSLRVCNPISALAARKWFLDNGLECPKELCQDTIDTPDKVETATNKSQDMTEVKDDIGNADVEQTNTSWTNLCTSDVAESRTTEPCEHPSKMAPKLKRIGRVFAGLNRILVETSDDTEIVESFGELLKYVAECSDQETQQGNVIPLISSRELTTSWYSRQENSDCISKITIPAKIPDLEAADKVISFDEILKEVAAEIVTEDLIEPDNVLTVIKDFLLTLFQDSKGNLESSVKLHLQENLDLCITETELHSCSIERNHTGSQQCSEHEEKVQLDANTRFNFEHPTGASCDEIDNETMEEVVDDSTVAKRIEVDKETTKEVEVYPTVPRSSEVNKETTKEVKGDSTVARRSEADKETTKEVEGNPTIARSSEADKDTMKEVEEGDRTVAGRGESDKETMKEVEKGDHSAGHKVPEGMCIPELSEFYKELRSLYSKIYPTAKKGSETHVKAMRAEQKLPKAENSQGGPANTEAVENLYSTIYPVSAHGSEAQIKMIEDQCDQIDVGQKSRRVENSQKTLESITELNCLYSKIYAVDENGGIAHKRTMKEAREYQSPKRKAPKPKNSQQLPECVKELASLYSKVYPATANGSKAYIKEAKEDDQAKQKALKAESQSIPECNTELTGLYSKIAPPLENVSEDNKTRKEAKGDQNDASKAENCQKLSAKIRELDNAKTYHAVEEGCDDKGTVIETKGNPITKQKMPIVENSHQSPTDITKLKCLYSKIHPVAENGVKSQIATMSEASGNEDAKRKIPIMKKSHQVHASIKVRESIYPNIHPATENDGEAHITTMPETRGNEGAIRKIPIMKNSRQLPTDITESKSSYSKVHPKFESGREAHITTVPETEGNGGAKRKIPIMEKSQQVHANTKERESVYQKIHPTAENNGKAHITTMPEARGNGGAKRKIPIMENSQQPPTAITELKSLYSKIHSTPANGVEARVTSKPETRVNEGAKRKMIITENSQQPPTAITELKSLYSKILCTPAKGSEAKKTTKEDQCDQSHAKIKVSKMASSQQQPVRKKELKSSKIYPAAANHDEAPIKIREEAKGDIDVKLKMPKVEQLPKSIKELDSLYSKLYPTTANDSEAHITTMQEASGNQGAKRKVPTMENSQQLPDGEGNETTDKNVSEKSEDFKKSTPQEIKTTPERKKLTAKRIFSPAPASLLQGIASKQLENLVLELEKTLADNLDDRNKKNISGFEFISRDKLRKAARQLGNNIDYVQDIGEHDIIFEKIYQICRRKSYLAKVTKPFREGLEYFVHKSQDQTNNSWRRKLLVNMSSAISVPGSPLFVTIPETNLNTLTTVPSQLKEPCFTLYGRTYARVLVGNSHRGPVLFHITEGNSLSTASESTRVQILNMLLYQRFYGDTSHGANCNNNCNNLPSPEKHPSSNPDEELDSNNNNNENTDDPDTSADPFQDLDCDSDSNESSGSDIYPLEVEEITRFEELLKETESIMDGLADPENILVMSQNFPLLNQNLKENFGFSFPDNVLSMKNEIMVHSPVQAEISTPDILDFEAEDLVAPDSVHWESSFQDHLQTNSTRLATKSEAVVHHPGISIVERGYTTFHMGFCKVNNKIAESKCQLRFSANEMKENDMKTLEAMCKGGGFRPIMKDKERVCNSVPVATVETTRGLHQVTVCKTKEHQRRVKDFAAYSCQIDTSRGEARRYVVYRHAHIKDLPKYKFNKRKEEKEIGYPKWTEEKNAQDGLSFSLKHKNKPGHRPKAQESPRYNKLNKIFDQDVEFLNQNSIHKKPSKGLETTESKLFTCNPDASLDFGVDKNTTPHPCPHSGRAMVGRHLKPPRDISRLCSDIATHGVPISMPCLHVHGGFTTYNYSDIQRLEGSSKDEYYNLKSNHCKKEQIACPTEKEGDKKALRGCQIAHQNIVTRQGQLSPFPTSSEPPSENYFRRNLIPRVAKTRNNQQVDKAEPTRKNNLNKISSVPVAYKGSRNIVRPSSSGEDINCNNNNGNADDPDKSRDPDQDLNCDPYYEEISDDQLFETSEDEEELRNLGKMDVGHETRFEFTAHSSHWSPRTCAFYQAGDGKMDCENGSDESSAEESYPYVSNAGDITPTIVDMSQDLEKLLKIEDSPEETEKFDFINKEYMENLNKLQAKVKEVGKEILHAKRKLENITVEDLSKRTVIKLSGRIKKRKKVGSNVTNNNKRDSFHSDLIGQQEPVAKGSRFYANNVNNNNNTDGKDTGKKKNKVLKTGEVRMIMKKYRRLNSKSCKLPSHVNLSSNSTPTESSSQTYRISSSRRSSSLRTAAMPPDVISANLDRKSSEESVEDNNTSCYQDNCGSQGDQLLEGKMFRELLSVREDFINSYFRDQAFHSLPVDRGDQQPQLTPDGVLSQEDLLTSDDQFTSCEDDLSVDSLCEDDDDDDEFWEDFQKLSAGREPDSSDEDNLNVINEDDFYTPRDIMAGELVLSSVPCVSCNTSNFLAFANIFLKTQLIYWHNVMEKQPYLSFICIFSYMKSQRKRISFKKPGLAYLCLFSFLDEYFEKLCPLANPVVVDYETVEDFIVVRKKQRRKSESDASTQLTPSPNKMPSKGRNTRATFTPSPKSTANRIKKSPKGSSPIPRFNLKRTTTPSPNKKQLEINSAHGQSNKASRYAKAGLAKEDMQARGLKPPPSPQRPTNQRNKQEVPRKPKVETEEKDSKTFCCVEPRERPIDTGITKEEQKDVNLNTVCSSKGNEAKPARIEKTPVNTTTKDNMSPNRERNEPFEKQIQASKSVPSVNKVFSQGPSIARSNLKVTRSDETDLSRSKKATNSSQDVRNNKTCQEIYLNREKGRQDFEDKPKLQKIGSQLGDYITIKSDFQKMDLSSSPKKKELCTFSKGDDKPPQKIKEKNSPSKPEWRPAYATRWYLDPALRMNHADRERFHRRIALAFDEEHSKKSSELDHSFNDETRDQNDADVEDFSHGDKPWYECDDYYHEDAVANVNNGCYANQYDGQSWYPGNYSCYGYYYGCYGNYYNYSSPDYSNRYCTQHPVNNDNNGYSPRKYFSHGDKTCHFDNSIGNKPLSTTDDTVCEDAHVQDPPAETNTKDDDKSNKNYPTGVTNCGHSTQKEHQDNTDGYQEDKPVSREENVKDLCQVVQDFIAKVKATYDIGKDQLAATAENENVTEQTKKPIEKLDADNERRGNNKHNNPAVNVVEDLEEATENIEIPNVTKDENCLGRRSIEQSLVAGTKNYKERRTKTKNGFLIQDLKHEEEAPNISASNDWSQDRNALNSLSSPSKQSERIAEAPAQPLGCPASPYKRRLARLVPESPEKDLTRADSVLREFHASLRRKEGTPEHLLQSALNQLKQLNINRELYSETAELVGTAAEQECVLQDCLQAYDELGSVRRVQQESSQITASPSSSSPVKSSLISKFWIGTNITK